LQTLYPVGIARAREAVCQGRLTKREFNIPCQFQTFLNERAKSLSRKLDVIEVMTTALTELIDAQREIRVEALIVLLIAVEIVIWLYEFF
jgi:hypothetical protein